MYTTSDDLPIPLSAAQMYRAEIMQRLPRLSQEERCKREQVLIDRLRAGEQAARDELLLLLQPHLFRLATRYNRPGKSADCEKWSDLVQEANLAMLVAIDRALLADNPCSYLLGVARFAMIKWICGHNDPIKRHNKQERIEVISFDRPLCEDGTTLADLLPEQDTTSTPETHFLELHEVIETLSKKYKVVVRRHYGFDGPAESLNAISRSLAKPGTRKTNVAYDCHQKALQTMRRRLEHVYA